MSGNCSTKYKFDKGKLRGASNKMKTYLNYQMRDQRIK
jgi:hypothetical protein